MQRSNKFVKKLRPVPTNCPFCAAKNNPDYKDATMLGKYITERGKLLGRARTGLCAKHQRRVEQAVKRSRIVALIPFVVRA
jgi:small subunit ribosomal protein S18